MCPEKYYFSSNCFGFLSEVYFGIKNSFNSLTSYGSIKFYLTRLIGSIESNLFFFFVILFKTSGYKKSSNSLKSSGSKKSYFLKLD